MNKSEQLISCLEGEIAKRDETIARLEPQLNRAIQANYDLREELAACRVAVENCDLFRARIAELEAKYLELASLSSRISVELPIAYALPVSEAKANGVVQWPNADEIMQMAFEEGQPADDASGYCFELGEFDLFIDRLMSEVARLNAAPVQQVSVPAWMASSRAFADRLYMAGWRDHADAQHSGVAGMYDELLAAAPVQQVSVPDGLELIKRMQVCLSLDDTEWGLSAPEKYKLLGDIKSYVLAAPAAPAADAWIPVSERLPESGRTVLVFYLNSHGKGRRIRAQYIKAWTVDVDDLADPDTECVEYSEQMGCYYLLEGWYECIDNWDEYYRVAVTEGPITHWMPLPAAPIKIEDASHDQ